MTLFAFAFALLMWLPGHLALRLSVGGSPAVRRWSIAERLFAEIAISGALMLWATVTLAELGLLTRGALIGVTVLPAAVLAAVAYRRRADLRRRASLRLDASVVAAVVLVGAGAFLYTPAFEQLSGGQDPVTYMISGIHLAREGTWVVHDELVTSIPEAHRQAFLGGDRRERLGHWGPFYLGWYLMDPDTGRVVPQGLPLYPSAIALGYLHAGVQGAIRVTTILAIGALLGLFFLGRRTVNLATGLTAAALLLVSPAQVWFSRFTNAETLAQLLLVTGLYGLVVFRRHGIWAYGLLAGLALGLTWQTHIWMVWLVLPLGGILLFDLLRGRVDRTALLAFWLPLTATGVHALIVYFTITTAYLIGVSKVARWTPWALAPVVPAVAALLWGVWYWGRSSASDQVPSGARKAKGGSEKRAGKAQDGGRTTEWPRLVAAALVVAAAAFAYWIRPVISNAWAAASVERLVQAVTFAVFVFAVAGIVVLLIDRRRGDATLCLLVVALGIIVPVLWYPSITRTLMWSLRRYQMFLPLIFLFAAVPLWIEDPSFQRASRTARRGRQTVSLIVAMVLFAMLGVQGWTYRGFKQPGESIALIDDIAAGLDDNAVLIFEARSGWGALGYAAPLAFWKGFDVVWLRDKNTDIEALRDFVRRQTQIGRPVYFFTQGFNYFVPDPSMVPHRRWTVQGQQLEEVFDVLPTTILTSTAPLASYRALPGGTNGPLDGMLDVGEWDDIYVGEVLPREVPGERTARWTKGSGGYFWLPGLQAGTREIIVNAASIAGSEHFNRTLTASLDGVELGEIPIVDEWIDYVFEVPSDWRPAEGEVPRLVLTTDPLQPDVVVGNGDTRYLGVFVNAVFWR